MRFCLLGLILTTICSNAQNLVENPSFEVLTACPDGISQLNRAQPWYSPSLGTPDLYNSCDSFGNVSVPSNNFTNNLSAHEGNGYAGIHLIYRDNYREFIQTELNECLREGRTYQMEFWFALSPVRDLPFPKNTLGVRFSESTAFYPIRGPLPTNPNLVLLDSSIFSQTDVWEKWSGTYTANGNEKFFQLGNFLSNSELNYSGLESGSYVFIDDIQLTPLSPYIYSQCISEICKGDTLVLEAKLWNSGFYWSLGSPQGPIIGTDPVIEVAPLQDQFYFLSNQNGLIDSIVVKVNQPPAVSIAMDCKSTKPKVWVLDPGNEVQEIMWSNGNSGVLEQTLEFGQHWVYVENALGCGETLPIEITRCNEYTVCQGEPFTYETDQTVLDGYWSDGPDGKNIISYGATLSTIPKKSSWYFLFEGYEILDSVFVRLLPDYEIDLRLLCYENYGIVEILNPLEDVLWSDGEKDILRKEVNFGKHWVQTTSKFGCKYVRDFTLLNDCQKLILCPGDSLVVSDWYVSDPRIFSHSLDDFFDLETRSAIRFYESDKLVVYSGDTLRYEVEVSVFPNYQPNLSISCNSGQTEVTLLNPVGVQAWSTGEEGPGPIMIGEVGAHWLDVTRGDGCTFRTNIPFELECKKITNSSINFLPNLITPNGDGKNDRFEFIGELKNTQLKIFDRWGKLVYESFNYQEDWDGYGLPSGIYYYQLHSEALGESWTGWVELMR